jgi:hypothetical protein
MIEAGRHQAIRNGEPLEAFSQHEDLVDDMLPYLSASLRYTQSGGALCKAVGVLIAYAEQLAENHGHSIDMNEGVRLRAERSTSLWAVLFRGDDQPTGRHDRRYRRQADREEPYRSACADAIPTIG